MSNFPIFLSIVVVVTNQQENIRDYINRATSVVGTLVSDYEIIIIDNASRDNTLSILEEISGENGLPNLQVYSLLQEVNTDVACWVGVENALGDYVAVIDPLVDDFEIIPKMLECIHDGTDVIFGKNTNKIKKSFGYSICSWIFDVIYKKLDGISLTNEAPSFRILSRKVINFILRHPSPTLTYRHLPATGGFKKEIINYSSSHKPAKTKYLNESIDKGMRLLVSTTRIPMRLVISLCFLGAASNLMYSFYIIIIALLKKDVASGWITLSLQQSGMFFLISLVLLVLSEYILQMATLSNEGPLYHIINEFNSVKMTRQEKLNIESLKTGLNSRKQDKIDNA